MTRAMISPRASRIARFWEAAPRTDGPLPLDSGRDRGIISPAATGAGAAIGG